MVMVPWSFMSRNLNQVLFMFPMNLKDFRIESVWTIRDYSILSHNPDIVNPNTAGPRLACKVMEELGLAGG